MDAVVLKSQILANLWPVLAALAGVIFWSGHLTARINQSSKAVSRLFEIIEKQTETINNKIDAHAKDTNERIDKLFLVQKGVKP